MAFKRGLEDSWQSVKPKRYKREPRLTPRDAVGAGFAGLSVVTIARTIQWAADAFGGGFHIPHDPALVLATAIGIAYARYFRQ